MRWYLFLILGLSGCITVEESTKTPDGQEIPGRHLLQREYEHVCELTLGKDFRAMETLLDRYGSKGFRLAGFLNKNGETYAFCMVR